MEKTLVGLNHGDALVVTGLEALGDSAPYIIKSIQSLAERGADFVSIEDGIDTTRDGGAFYKFIATMSRFESAARARKVKRSMLAASRSGRKLGRPRKLSEWHEIEVRRAYRKGEETVGSLARKYGVSTMTIYKTLDETGERDRP